jgi:hypothetical protein
VPLVVVSPVTGSQSTSWLDTRPRREIGFASFGHDFEGKRSASLPQDEKRLIVHNVYLIRPSTSGVRDYL